jgi:small subunit ribosomal protein S21
VQIIVRDNNVDQALRALKKKMQREGIFREMKLRNYYEKPSEKRAREKAEAIRRGRKLARKRMQRESGRGKPKLAPLSFFLIVRSLKALSQCLPPSS